MSDHPPHDFAKTIRQIKAEIGITGCKAEDPRLLEAMIMDSRLAKPAPMWWAKGEIEMLREENNRLSAALTEIRDILPLQNDEYARRIFRISADALEPDGAPAVCEHQWKSLPDPRGGHFVVCAKCREQRHAP